MQEKSLVTFDEHGIFEIQDSGLLEAVSGGWGVSLHFSPSKSNGTCGTDINEECGTQTNGACQAVVNTICGQNDNCATTQGPEVSLSPTVVI